MDNFTNKLQLLQKEDEIKKKKQKKKKIINSSSSSGTSIASCVNSTTSGMNIKSIASSGSSSSRGEGEGGGGGGGGGELMKLSTDPQSVAARQRRHRISDRFKMLQSLIPGGSKMDTVSMLEEAIHYVKFLKTQLWIHHTIMTNSINHDLADTNQHLIHQPISDIDHQHDHLLLNSIINFNSSDSSPTTNAHVNNMINYLSLSSSPPSPPPQYPPHQFLYSSSSSSSSTNTTTNYIPAAAAGISGMRPLPPPVQVPMATTFSPAFCCDHLPPWISKVKYI